MPNYRKQIIICPVVGKPYIAEDKNGDNLQHLQEIVDGYMERVNPNNFVIHPLFVEEEPRWAAIKTLQENLKKRQYTIYVNEDGINKNLCPNMACINANPLYGAFPLMGMVAIVLTKQSLEKLNLNLPTKNFLEDESESEDEPEFDDDTQYYLTSKN